jgi:type II restriction enzyme
LRNSFGSLAIFAAILRECKRSRTLKRLPNNFKCADVICDFCGYLGQVKAMTVNDVEEIPTTVLGTARGPQKERMAAAIYFRFSFWSAAFNLLSLG